MTKVLILSIFWSSAAALAQETRMIIPVYSSEIASAASLWKSRLTVTNPTSSPQILVVEKFLPGATESCDACETEAQWVVPAKRSVQIDPAIGGGRRMVIGAVVLRASGHIQITHRIFNLTPPGSFASQDVPALSDYLEAGEEHLIPDVILPPLGRANLFVANPGEHAITVRYWAGERDLNEKMIVVAPETLQVIALQAPLCEGGPCQVGGVIPPPSFSIHLSATSEFSAGISSVGLRDAFFSVPETRVSHAH